MSHTVHGLIRKAPFIKQGCGQGGESTMFVVELSEMTKDFQTQEKLYSNYKAMIFAKSPAQVDYYNKALAEGSFVVVSCEKLKVEQREHNGKIYITLMMDNPRLEGAHFDDNQPQRQPQQAPQQQYQQAPMQQQPQRQPSQQPQQGFNQPQQPQPNAPQNHGYPQQQPAQDIGFSDEIPL